MRRVCGLGLEVVKLGEDMSAFVICYWITGLWGSFLLGMPIHRIDILGLTLEAFIWFNIVWLVWMRKFGSCGRLE